MTWPPGAATRRPEESPLQRPSRSYGPRCCGPARDARLPLSLVAACTPRARPTFSVPANVVLVLETATAKLRTPAETHTRDIVRPLLGTTAG